MCGGGSVPKPREMQAAQTPTYRNPRQSAKTGRGSTILTRNSDNMMAPASTDKKTLLGA